ncbi:hypothetical protein OFC55_42690, partial [Escherichia coli]|nr:hypothetical protein [Escherichia coli]
MLFLLNEDQEIAGRAAAFAGVAGTVHAKLHALLHAGRNIQVQRFITVYTPFALAGSALSRDGLAFATAVR